MLSLIKETGAGLAEANAYADVADGDAYHAGHLYASAWAAATAEQKTVALVMATRLIDAEFQFYGTRTLPAQALQWPRAKCTDPDAPSVPMTPLMLMPSNYVRYDTVPKAVMDATCEVARAMLIEDRTANPLGEGLAFTGLGSSQTSFDKKDRRPIIPYLAQAMLSKFGSPIRATSGAVRLTRACICPPRPISKSSPRNT
jgi:hypothetical protein